MSVSSPVITSMQVIPVAGYDSMLMTLSGAHAPCFTRNIVILKDSAGHTGIGEIHGGDFTCESLNAVRPLVEGQPVACYRQVLQQIHKLTRPGGEGDLQTLDIAKLKFVVKSEWAIECAMLDLMGQFAGVPMCQLLGEGKQRSEVEVLGYLFYVSDKRKYTGPGIPYLDESESSDPWFRLRRQEILTPGRLAEEAQAVHEKYGVTNFKLKGGVLPGEEEMEGLRALKKLYPDARINIDPNGAWSLDEAIRLCRPMRDVITYVEDPCGPEAGYSGREIMREFKNAVQLPAAQPRPQRRGGHAVPHPRLDLRPQEALPGPLKSASPHNTKALPAAYPAGPLCGIWLYRKGTVDGVGGRRRVSSPSAGIRPWPGRPLWST